MDNHGYLKVKRHQCSFNNSETFRGEKTDAGSSDPKGSEKPGSTPLE